MAALTAVLLQAGTADPDLVQALLADHDCWPALLAVCTAQPSTPAQTHTQRLHQLSSDACLPTVGLAVAGCGECTQQEVLPQCGLKSNAGMASEPGCAGDSTQQVLCDQEEAAEDGGNPNRQSSSLLWTHDMQHTASAVSHVAQLITCFVQSQSELGSPPEKHSGTDSLIALLHCYAVHAATASCPLSAPVWPPQGQLQRQQHAMLEHVAQAGGVILVCL